MRNFIQVFLPPTTQDHKGVYHSWECLQVYHPLWTSYNVGHKHPGPSQHVQVSLDSITWEQGWHTGVSIHSSTCSTMYPSPLHKYVHKHTHALHHACVHTASPYPHSHPHPQPDRWTHTHTPNFKVFADPKTSETNCLRVFSLTLLGRCIMSRRNTDPATASCNTANLEHKHIPSVTPLVSFPDHLKMVWEWGSNHIPNSPFNASITSWQSPFCVHTNHSAWLQWSRNKDVSHCNTTFLVNC